MVKPGWIHPVPEIRVYIGPRCSFLINSGACAIRLTLFHSSSVFWHIGRLILAKRKELLGFGLVSEAFE